MYHSYEKLAAPEEAGIADFVGDYLLVGKSLLGHNKNDKPENSDNRVQFQHSPNGLGFLFYHSGFLTAVIKEISIQQYQIIHIAETTGFHLQLFRPPLV